MAIVPLEELAALREQIETLTAMLEASGIKSPEDRLLDLADQHGIRPMRLYTAKEVADILGVKRVQSIYEISEDKLPRSQRTGTTHGYLGINVLAYIAEVPPVDVGAAVEAFREKIMADRTVVQPLRSEGDQRRRIM